MNYKFVALALFLLLGTSFAGVTYYENAYANMTVYPDPVPYAGESDWQYFEVCAKQAGQSHSGYIFDNTLESMRTEIYGTYWGTENQVVYTNVSTVMTYTMSDFTELSSPPPRCDVGSIHPLNTKYLNISMPTNGSIYACLNHSLGLVDGTYTISWWKTQAQGSNVAVLKTGYHEITTPIKHDTLSNMYGGRIYTNANLYYESYTFAKDECVKYRIKFKVTPGTSSKYDVMMWGGNANCLQDKSCTYEALKDPTFDDSTWDWYRTYNLTVEHTSTTQETILINFTKEEVNLTCFIPGYDRWVYVDPNNANNRTALNFHYFYTNTTTNDTLYNSFWAVAINMTRTDTPVINGTVLQHYYCNNTEVSNNSNGNETYFFYDGFPAGSAFPTARWTVEYGSGSIGANGGLYIPASPTNTKFNTSTQPFGMNTTFISTMQDPGGSTDTLYWGFENNYFVLTYGSYPKTVRASAVYTGDHTYNNLWGLPQGFNVLNITYLLRRNQSTSTVYGHYYNLTDRIVTDANNESFKGIYYQIQGLHSGSSISFVAVANTTADVSWTVSNEHSSNSVNTYIISPEATTYNATGVTFNITANGSFNSYSCNYTLNGATNATNLTVLNNSFYSAPWTLSFNNYALYVTCSNDTTTNTASVSFNVGDMLAIRLTAPDSTFTYNVTSTVPVNFTLTNSSMPSAHCWDNFKTIETDLGNITMNTPYTKSLTPGGLGIYTYNVTCLRQNDTNTSYIVSFTVADNLSIRFDLPLNQSYFTHSVPHSFVLMNTSMPSAHCWQTFDGVTTNLGNLSILANNSYPLTAATGGHTINVTCTNANNTNISYIQYFDVRTYNVNSSAYETTVLETNTSYYNLSIYLADFVSSANFTFTHNGTNYTASVSNNGAQYYMTASVPIPLMLQEGNTVAHTWSGNFTLTNGTTIPSSTLSNATQLVNLAYSIVSITANTTTVFTGDVVQVNVTLLAKLPYATMNATGILWPSTGFKLTETNYTLWQGTVTVPSITGANGTINISAFVNFTFNGVTRLNTSANLTLNIYSLILTNCSAGSMSQTVVLNFTHVDEFDFALLNGSDQVTFTVWNNQRTVGTNFSFNFTSVSSFAICLYPADVSVKVDSIHTYTATRHFAFNSTGNLTNEYFPREYFLRNANISSATTYINLYSINKTFPFPGSQPSRVEFQVFELDNTNSVNTVLFIRKYLPANNTYLTVAMIKTDTEGKSNTYLLPNDPIYKFSFVREDLTTGEIRSQVKIEPGDYISTGSDGVANYFHKLYLPAPILNDYYTNHQNWLVSCTSNSTGVWCDYQDLTGATKTWNLTLDYHSTERYVLNYCHNSSTGQSVLLSCIPPVGIGNYSFTASVIITDQYGVQTSYVLLHEDQYSGRSNYGIEGVVAALLLFGIMCGVGMTYHSAAAVLFGIMAFVISAYFGLFTPAGDLMVIVIGIIIVAAIIIWKAMGK